jgi:hypothetical protein
MFDILQSMSKGLLYFARNSAFQHLTKIGKTTKEDFEKRGLSASNVPEPFEPISVLECENVDWAEQKVHEQFKGYRHFSQVWNKLTEFFWSGCIEKAIQYARDLKGVIDITEKETEEIETKNEQGQKEIKKATRSTFEMIGIPVNAEIFFHNDPKEKAVVLDTINKIEYMGQQGAISQIGKNIFTKKGLHGNCNGFVHFYYKGKKLFDMRPDQQ